MSLTGMRNNWSRLVTTELAKSVEDKVEARDQASTSHEVTHFVRMASDELRFAVARYFKKICFSKIKTNIFYFKRSIKNLILT